VLQSTFNCFAGKKNLSLLKGFSLAAQKKHYTNSSACWRQCGCLEANHFLVKSGPVHYWFHFGGMFIKFC